jgi:hypothetical protein
MSFASLLILMGLSPWDPKALIPGIVLAVIAFALGVYLATRPWDGRRRPPEVVWGLGGLAVFYLIAAVAAATVGPIYAVAAMAAGLIPMTAAGLIIATARRYTVRQGDRLEDASTDAQDEWPGIGFDDRSPLGDTPEHSDAPEGAPVPGSGRFRRPSQTRTRR